ncbi:hypothetical protein FIBSPDRAFT_930822 [Athelia psychrophila]|uniref:G domain-containing protein n=1 Tax=Athelia psychrophila TaxID=1759441 RepID=A0A166LE63_9AGAM|nr:hypothetical protein FIBSPDRAFT_930822 [Fibularhizoctonia sp. CBS 109695]
MFKKFKKSSPALLVPAIEPRHGPRNPIPGPSVPAKAMPKMNLIWPIIRVMGATGTGKSTFINLVSGSKLRVGADLKSCTSDVEATAPFTFEGRKVVLFDTPGFDDTTKSDTDILIMVAESLAKTYENGERLAGVIYMHHITDVRMGGTAIRNFSMFRMLCGDDSLKNVAIVTNFWSEVVPAKGVEREKQLQEVFFKPVLDKQAKLLRHDGTRASASIIITAIAGNVPLALDIQTELVDANKSILETAAGTELNRELVEQKHKHEKELKEIREEMRVAMQEHNEESQQELQMTETKLKADVQPMQTDLLKLAATLSEVLKKLEEKLQAENLPHAERDMLLKRVEVLLQQAEQQRNRNIFGRLFNTR